MRIYIDAKEMHELATTIDTLMINNGFLLNAINSLLQMINEQKLYGVEKEVYEKLEAYERYFDVIYEEMLIEIRRNINKVGSTFSDQDIMTGKKLL